MDAGRVPDLASPVPNESANHLVAANYSKLSDHIRRLTPQGIQCSVFCGGSNCKYENPENWTADSLALQGIYSHWITDDILAMARPSTIIIAKKNIIQQFESLGIKSIINLQCPKEHASCGHELESSGFSYDPTVFMENNIYYYNFAWKDYGDASLSGLLNMVKVLAFAISEGRVAVHCHAGLGRTGVLIACYLVYSLRVSANDAIRYVRYRRPGSVQTRGQIVCVRHFAQFILPQITTFFIKDCASKDKYMVEFTLKKFLKRQKVVLHGYDERNYKYLPKIVHVVCERILKLCGCWKQEFPQSNLPFTTDFLTTRLQGGLQRHESSYSVCSVSDVEEARMTSPASSPASPCSDSSSEISMLDGEELTDDILGENRCFQELETRKAILNDSSTDQYDICDIESVVEALVINSSDLSTEEKRYIKQIKCEINCSQSGWNKLDKEVNVRILATLLHDWLECLKLPPIGPQYLENIVVLYKQPETCFQKFDLEDAYLVEYLLHFIAKIQPLNAESQIDILKRFICSLTHRSLIIANKHICPNFQKLHDGTLGCTIEFFQSLLQVIEDHHKVITEEKGFMNFVREDDSNSPED